MNAKAHNIELDEC